MNPCNFHTHSKYCDGRGELREYVEYALSLGFSALGFSSHAPVPFENRFALKQEDFGTYCNEVRQLQQEYKDRITLRLGLEIDYIPHILDDFSHLVPHLDYFIGSVHLVGNPDEAPDNLWFIDGSKREVYDEGLQRVFKGDIHKAVNAFFSQTNAMIDNTKPTIIGHFNKVVMHNAGRYFSEDDQWFKNLVAETVDHIAASGAICEINTRGIYKKRHDDFYPSREILKYMKTQHIPVVVSTDAHDPENLDTFYGAYEFLDDIGYKDVVTSI